MTRSAPITARCEMPADVDAIQHLLVRLTDGEPASRELDAAVMEALGWSVWDPAAVHAVRSGTYLMRSPLSTRAQPVPRVSGDVDAARLTLPYRWDWSVGERGGRPFASAASGPMPARHWFEANAATPALALLRVGLHGQHALICEHIWPTNREAPWGGPVLAAAPAETRECVCGWMGSADALPPGGRCPDCSRAISDMDT